MSNLSAVVTAAYNSSREADQIGKELKKYFGSDANYEVIRLALGRSLGLETPPEPAPDAKGSPIKGLQLFGDESNANYLWIALLGEELRLTGGEADFSLEGLQKLVRDHSEAHRVRDHFGRVGRGKTTGCRRYVVQGDRDVDAACAWLLDCR